MNKSLRAFLICVTTYVLFFVGWSVLKSQDLGTAPNTPRRVGRDSLPNIGEPGLSALPQASTPTLSVTSLSTFVYQIGGASPADQFVSVSSTESAVAFSAVTTTPWLNISPTSARTPAQIRISANPSGLPVNTYSASVTFNSPDISNGPLSLPVSLVVNPQQPAPDLAISALVAPSTGVIGASLSGISVTVTNQGNAGAPASRIEFYLSQKVSVTASDVNTNSGCAVPALAAGATASCSNPINIPSSISPGTYYLGAIADPTGTVTETNRTNNTRVSGPIALSAPAANLAQLVITSFLAPTSAEIGGSISGISLSVANTGTAAAPAFRVEYFLSRNSTVSLSDTDTTWGCDVTGLAAGASFQCGGSIGIPPGLTPGQYYLAAIADSLKVVSQPNRTLNVRNNDNGPLTLTAPSSVTIAAGGIVETFTGTKGLSPGLWVSIYGSNLASSTRSWDPQPNQLLATTLDGVTVKVNGIPAPLSYVSPTQVNILVPSNAGEGTASIAVSSPVGTATATMQSTHYLPAIYCIPAAGATPAKYYVTAVNPVTGEYVGNAALDTRVTRAAKPGETIDLYAVGLGPPSGSLFPTDTLFSTAYPLALDFTANLGGTAVTPTYAALVGLGLYQVRLTVPLSSPAGDLPIYLDFAGVQSSPSVFLSVHQ